MHTHCVNYTKKCTKLHVRFRSITRPQPIVLKILPIMLLSSAQKSMLSKSRLCLRTNCFIRVHEYLPTVVFK